MSSQIGPTGHKADGVIAKFRLDDEQGLAALRTALARERVTLSLEIQSADTHGAVAIVLLARSKITADESRPEIAVHAAERWANAVVPLIDSPADPRTIEDWGKWIAASPSAVRNWCRTAGVEPRRSLTFGRLLRAVILSENGRYRPENVLDVVDRRTLTTMLTRAGLDATEALPPSVPGFLQRQKLIRDDDMLRQVERMVERRSVDAEHRGRIAV